jgi:hypothetical protein
MSVSRRATTGVEKLTLFSSEGILSTALADGDKEQSVFGNSRPVSSKSTKNVLRTIICGVHSPASVELDTKPGVSTKVAPLNYVD